MSNNNHNYHRSKPMLKIYSPASNFPVSKGGSIQLKLNTGENNLSSVFFAIAEQNSAIRENNYADFDFENKIEVKLNSWDIGNILSVLHQDVIESNFVNNNYSFNCKLLYKGEDVAGMKISASNPEKDNSVKTATLSIAQCKILERYLNKSVDRILGF